MPPAEHVAPPPSPPPPPPPPPEIPAPPLADEARMRIAIGPNADHYVARFREMVAKGSPLGWSLAGCLGNLWWFLYRKMWVAAAGIAFVFLVFGALSIGNANLALISFVLMVGATVVTGLFGDHLYRRHVEGLVERHGGDTAELEARGGVSRPALYAGIGVAVLLFLLVFALAVQQAKRERERRSPPEQSQTIQNDPLQNSQTDNSNTDIAPPYDSGPTIAGPPTLDTNFLIGRWTDDGNCSNALEFTSNGTFIAADGGSGVWYVQGNQLTLSGPGGTQALQVNVIDQNTVSVTMPDGSAGGVSTRC